jgi:membrane-associated phospholipid phosphatase
MRTLDANAFTGIVTFPSFHAAGAVLLACAWWQVPGLRYPGVALNAAMLVSAIPCGGHYLSDLIAGCGIAGAIIWAVGRYFGRTERSDLEVLPEPVSVIWNRHARLFREAPHLCLLRFSYELCSGRRWTGN